MIVSKPAPPSEREGGVAAAIIELDALADAVRPAAEDDDLARVADLRLVLRLAEQGRLVGRVEIGRRRVELGGAAVDALEHRPDAEPQAVRAHLLLGDAAGQRLASASWTMPEPARRRLAHLALRHGPSASASCASRASEKPIAFNRRMPAASRGRPSSRKLLLGGDDLRPAARGTRGRSRRSALIRSTVKPCRSASAATSSRSGVGRASAFSISAGSAFSSSRIRSSPHRPVLQPAQRLLQALGEAAADRHHLADRLHRRRQRARRARGTSRRRSAGSW